MNPLFNLVARLVFSKVASDVLTPAPKTKTKGKPVAKKVWNRAALFGGGAILAYIGLGLYTGQMDANTALSMLGSIDFNGIFGN